MIRLLTPNSRPAKCNATDDDAGGWLGSVVTRSPVELNSGLKLDPSDGAGSGFRFSLLQQQNREMLVKHTAVSGEIILQKFLNPAKTF